MKKLFAVTAILSFFALSFTSCHPKGHSRPCDAYGSIDQENSKEYIDQDLAFR